MDDDSPLTAGFQESLNKYFPFILEIRKRLFYISAIFTISAFVGFLYYEKIVTVIIRLLNIKGVNIVFTSPFQFFTLAVNSGLLLGLFVALPLIINQLLSFIRPALSRKEYRAVQTMVPLTLLLFVFGFAYGVGIMKYVVAIFYQKSIELQIGNFLDINLLLSNIVMTGALMGTSFQFPLVMTILMKLDVISREQFVRQRMLAYSVAIIFAALLPPTDVLSLAFLTLPLIMLFEITLLFTRFIKVKVGVKKSSKGRR